VATALAKVNTKAAQQILAKMAVEENDPKCQWSIVDAFDHRDPELKKAAEHVAKHYDAYSYR
jgi:hypothetical protein